MTRNSLREMESVGSLADKDVAFMEEAEVTTNSAGGGRGAWAVSEVIRLNVSCPGCEVREDGALEGRLPDGATGNRR